MCALTWVVFVPGFFYADRLHSGFSTCVNLKCTVYVSNSSIWPHTNTRAYTHFLQCSPASVCFGFFFFFSKVGLLETTYAISCIHYTHQKLNLHIVIASGLHIWAEVACWAACDGITIDKAMLIATDLEDLVNYRIAGNFRGVQFSRKGNLQRFRGLIFADGRSRTAPPTIPGWLRLLPHARAGSKTRV